jgi:hypothetical protein
MYILLRYSAVPRIGPQRNYHIRLSAENRFQFQVETETSFDKSITAEVVVLFTFTSQLTNLHLFLIY